MRCSLAYCGGYRRLMAKRERERERRWMISLAQIVHKTRRSDTMQMSFAVAPTATTTNNININNPNNQNDKDRAMESAMLSTSQV
jgi:hypothetical protein